MIRQGPEWEIHPVIREVSKVLGPVMGPIMSAICKGVLGIIVGVFLRRFAGYIFVTASIISLWAAWYNIWGYKFYTPIILRWLPW